MQIKITNEQPFQVLGTNFTIGPSSSGYDLMFSADGVEYSKLFTVGANTNRQVTQVAAGSYYFLSGNTDTVTVNWMKNCGGSGSGGGSYVLPVASSDTLGGIKVGSGLTMSGDTLNANTGGYTLPMASDAVLGGIKVGSGLTIDANGVLSTSGDTYVLPVASDSTLGGVKVGSGLTIDENGVISADVQAASVNAGSGITIDSDNNVSVNAGDSIGFDVDGHLQVEIGAGMDRDENDALTLNIGDGLAFSGNTLVVSGGTSSNTRVVMLNKLTQQERLDLYNELASLYDYQNSGWSSAYTEDMFAFYLDLRDLADQQAANVQDAFEGFFPMQCARMHPSDYGGAAIFTGVEGNRVGNGWLIDMRYVICYDGSVDGPSSWQNGPAEQVEYARWLYITSAGTIANDQDWSSVADDDKAGQVRMRYNYSSGSEEATTFGCLKWLNRYKISYNDESKWYYIWSADVLIGNTVYTGIWGMMQDEWYSQSTVPPQLLSWTSGTTITPPYSPLP